MKQFKNYKSKFQKIFQNICMDNNKINLIDESETVGEFFAKQLNLLLEISTFLDLVTNKQEFKFHYAVCVSDYICAYLLVNGFGILCPEILKIKKSDNEEEVHQMVIVNRDKNSKYRYLLPENWGDDFCIIVDGYDGLLGELRSNKLYSTKFYSFFGTLHALCIEYKKYKTSKANEYSIDKSKVTPSLFHRFIENPTDSELIEMDEFSGKKFAKEMLPIRCRIIINIRNKLRILHQKCDIKEEPVLRKEIYDYLFDKGTKQFARIKNI